MKTRKLGPNGLEVSAVERTGIFHPAEYARHVGK